MIIAACTTHRLSYVPNNRECLVPIKSYAPIREYQASDIPMESETTMRLSYQLVEPAGCVEKPWAAAVPYYPPVNPMEDNTTYNLRFAPCPHPIIWLFREYHDTAQYRFYTFINFGIYNLSS